MALPSLVDIVTVIVILLPGFLSFILFKWTSIIQRKFSDFETVVWSLFVSLLIYLIFGAITGISDFDTIRDSILLPSTLFLILTLSLSFGLIPGGIVRYAFRKRVVRGDCWDVCMSRADSTKNWWVIVYTQNGLEYKGRLHVYGTEGEYRRELVIEEPKLIQRDSDGRVKREVQAGKEILFSQQDIRRIAFLEELREPEKSSAGSSNTVKSS